MILKRIKEKLKKSKRMRSGGRKPQTSFEASFLLKYQRSNQLAVQVTLLVSEQTQHELLIREGVQLGLLEVAALA